MDTAQRCITQIAAAATNGKLRLFALDNRGRVWYLDDGSQQWKPVVPLPEVPQPGLAP